MCNKKGYNLAGVAFLLMKRFFLLIHFLQNLLYLALQLIVGGFQFVNLFLLLLDSLNEHWCQFCVVN